MWPRFKLTRRRCHMWVEFVGGSLPCSKRFFSDFPSPQKPTFPNSSSTRNQVDEEPLCGCATSKSLMFIIYLISQFTCLSNLLWVKLSKTLARQLVNAIGLRCDLISRGGEIFGTGVIINLFKESGRNPSCNDRL